MKDMPKVFPHVYTYTGVYPNERPSFSSLFSTQEEWWFNLENWYVFVIGEMSILYSVFIPFQMETV